MPISKKPRVCYHRFPKNSHFCTSPGCGVPRHYVEAQLPKQSDKSDQNDKAKS